MQSRHVRVVAFVGTVVSFWLAPLGAQVEELRVRSSNGVRAALEELRPQSQKSAGRALDMTFGTSASTKQRIIDGEAFDVAVLTTDAIDELIVAGKLTKASRVLLGRSGIGVGVRAGAPKPDIHTADALKRALVAARSVTYASDGASRPHIERMLKAFGIAEAVNAKTVLEQGSVRAAARVAKGETEFIITLISEIVPVPGIELVGPLPPEFQSYVSFAAAAASNTRNGDAVKKLVAYLSSPEASPTFVAKGIDRGER